jgi:hypothetical protein
MHMQSDDSGVRRDRIRIASAAILIAKKFNCFLVAVTA